MKDNKPKNKFILAGGLGIAILTLLGIILAFFGASTEDINIDVIPDIEDIP